MFCTNCGKEVKDDISFCPECGAIIKKISSSDENNYSEQSSSNSNVNQSGDINKAVFEYQKIDKPKLGMKWHYFLIVYLVVNGGGSIYSGLNEMRFTTPIVTIGLLASGVISLYIAYLLYSMKRNSPKYVQYFFIAYVVLQIIAFAFIVAVFNVCVILYTRKYYQERESLFVN